MKDKTKIVEYFGSSRLASAVSREAYASDGSIYRIKPEKVICPKTETEAVAAVNEAFLLNKPVTPRGAGTGLAGGALGKGYIIDCSRLTEVKKISEGERTVICESGIIYNDLNIALKPFGLFFPPNPSSGDSCQIGGMLANNASGLRSIKYGLTSDYVEELTIIGREGQPLTVRKYQLASYELKSFLSAYPEYGRILSLLRDNRELIINRWPKLKKNSSGYNLRQVVRELDKGIFNLPALYVGSQGTLGLFLSVKLRLLPLPEGERALFRLFFDCLEDAGRAVAPLMETGPAALEIIDGVTLDLIGRDEYSIPPKVEAMLLLEYDDSLKRRRQYLGNLAGKLKLAVPPEEAADEQERESLWAARRAIVPMLYRYHPTRRPFPVIEDVSLPVPKLTEFIAWIKQRLAKENLIFGLYGHVGDGNLHIRPLFDISKGKGFELAQTIYDEVYDKIFELGGSSTAEHADGRLRAPVVRRMYGDEIYRLFLRVKSILDPDNRFNPDVLLSGRKLTDDIDFKKLELTCAACGKCNGYCPAFEVFRREDMSPRGWLRMLHQGNADRAEFDAFSKYCLNCKSCTTVCPAGVDISGEILKFRATHPNKIAGRVISLFDRPGLFSGLLKAGAISYPLSRTTPGRKLTALAGHRRFGLDDKAVFPRPAGKTLRKRYPELCRETGAVAFFHGCADNYFVSGAGDALIKVAQYYGWDLAMPPQKCCGLPMEVYGHRQNLIDKAKYNIDALGKFEAVVFTCASCLHRIAEYHELFEEGSTYHRKALELKDRVFDISQYLLTQDVEMPRNGSHGEIRLSYHHPCHLRACGLENEPLRMLSQLEGIEILHPELADRCCGQAGSFGYIHYKEGMAIFAPKKKEYQQMQVKTIVSSCPACISKIQKEMGDDVRVCHPIEIVADLIEGKPINGK